MQPALIPLESIQIASPCRTEWNAMQPVRGQDCVRFCPSCGKNVFDLSGMTRDEAMRLMAEKEGRLCLRIHRRSDGTVITSDCPVGSAAVRKRGQIAGLFAAVTGWGVAVFGMANVWIHRLPVAPQIKLPAPGVLTRTPLLSRNSPPQQEMTRVPERAPIVEKPSIVERPPAFRSEPVIITNAPATDVGVTTTMGAPAPPMPTPVPASPAEISATKPLEPVVTNSST